MFLIVSSPNSRLMSAHEARSASYACKISNLQTLTDRGSQDHFAGAFQFVPSLLPLNMTSTEVWPFEVEVRMNEMDVGLVVGSGPSRNAATTSDL